MSLKARYTLKGCRRLFWEVILENFEKLNEAEASTSDKPESYRVLRNRKVIISSDTPITKYNSLTFSYFTYIILDSISIEIYKLSFVNLLSFLIFYHQKQILNKIYKFRTNSTRSSKWYENLSQIFQLVKNSLKIKKKFVTFIILNSMKFRKSRHLIDLVELILNIFILLGLIKYFLLQFVDRWKNPKIFKIQRLILTYILFHLILYSLSHLDSNKKCDLTLSEINVICEVPIQKKISQVTSYAV